MSNTKSMVVVSSHPMNDDRSTIAWTLANGGQASGYEVTVFLVSSAVDAVRKGAADHVRMNPLDPPLKELIDDFMAKGGTVMACPPCAKVRGYEAENLIEGVELAGAAALYAKVSDGASTLCI